jgi:hypothetical protein
MIQELPKTLQKGELVLLSPYPNCGFMILAEYSGPSPAGNDVFYAERAEILQPLTKWRLLPQVDRDLEFVISTLDIKSGIISSNPFKSAYEVRISPFKDSQFWIGLENIIKALRETPNYQPHASSIEASMKLQGKS